MISCDSKTERGALLVSCCVKQKRTGELCWWVIRASGYADNRFLNILFKEDKGALLHAEETTVITVALSCALYFLLICSLASKCETTLISSVCLCAVHHLHCLPPVP